LVLNNHAFVEKNVAYLSTYPPRECGIAAFTKDLLDAIDGLREFPASRVIAINEEEAIYDYDKRVKFTVERGNVQDYIQAAEYVNNTPIDMVNIQHEFGLFGGENGNYIIDFIENLKKPIVMTLHTVQENFQLIPKRF
jgi:hypothetical protein